MFTATNGIHNVEVSDGKLIFEKWDKVETSKGWVTASSLIKGDCLLVEENSVPIESIEYIDNSIICHI